MNDSSMHPAWRLTPESVWTAYEISGKRHLFFTGDRNVGKTTFLTKMFPKGYIGITTKCLMGYGVYLKEETTGLRSPLGLFEPGKGMVAVASAFEELAVPAVKRTAESSSDWVVVDEIGFLERDFPEFLEALDDLFLKKHVVAVVRKQDALHLNRIINRPDAFALDLDEPFGNAGCIIMASGVGKRFGGNKLMADYKGVPLISGALNATDGLFNTRAIVTRNPDTAAYCRGRIKNDGEVIVHDLPKRSDTVRLGMKKIRDTDRVMFVQGDQPLLTQDTVMKLLLCSKAQPEYIWRAGHDENQGAPVVFPKWAYEELMDLPEGRGGGWLAAKYPEKVRVLQVDDRNEFKDIDTREDLEQLLAFVNNGARI